MAELVVIDRIESHGMAPFPMRAAVFHPRQADDRRKTPEDNSRIQSALARGSPSTGSPRKEAAGPEHTLFSLKRLNDQSPGFNYLRLCRPASRPG
jgi:hypothetical protein